MRPFSPKEQAKYGCAGFIVDFTVELPGGQRIRERKLLRNVSEAQAREWERRQREIILARAAKQLSGPAPTLREFAAEWLRTYAAAHLKASSLHEVNRVLNTEFLPRFGDLPINQIKEPELLAYVAEKKQAGTGPKTISNHVVILTGILKTAVQWRRIAESPKPPTLKWRRKKIKTLDEDQQRRLLEVASPRWRPMILAALKTGMRLGELRALEWSHVDLKRRQINLAQAAWRYTIDATKTYHDRTIPIAESLAATLSQVPESERRGYVFGSPTAPVNVYTAHDAMKYYGKKAGFGPLGWHILRHSFATTCLRKGVDVKTVSRWLGHANISTTSIYLHAIEGEKGPETIDRIDQ